MSALKDRIEELQRITGWNDTQTAKAAGVSRSAVAQWAGKGSKIIHAISDVEVALNLERETGLSALWIAKGSGPKLAVHRMSAEFWPFTALDEDKVRKLDQSERDRFEGAILVAAAQLGLDVKKDK